MKRIENSPSRAFTLIELLIVVAIIAILAAIAVPNFLEAQTRAKVSRVKSDMRVIVTGIEAYAVDYGRPPFDWADDQPVPYYLNKVITTPISYISNARMEDTFAVKQVSQANNAFRERFRYRAFTEWYLSSRVPDHPPVPGSFFSGLPNPEAIGMQEAQRVHGAYFLASKGPDGTVLPLPTGFMDGANLTDWLWLQYNPTNGTISPGDILRSQKNPDPSNVGYDTPVTYPAPPPGPGA